MKKILGLLLSIMLILSLTACLEKPSSTTESSQPSKNSVVSNSNKESGNADGSISGIIGFESAEIESGDAEKSESDSEDISYSWEDDGLLDSDDDGVIETPYI